MTRMAESALSEQDLSPIRTVNIMRSARRSEDSDSAPTRRKKRREKKLQKIKKAIRAGRVLKNECGNTGKHKDENLVQFIGNFRKEDLHTSGHAYVDTIKKVIDAVKPKVIIPMHTECADEFKNFDEFLIYKERVEVLSDGKIFDIV